MLQPFNRAALSAAVQAQILPTTRVQRQLRRPSHRHYLVHRPWQIQPFLLAPVIPGETMKNLNLQSRVISDPLATGPGNILPWWVEHFIFYVKLRDLDIREDIEAMMLTGSDLAAHNTAADAAYFHAGNGVNWAKLCLKRVVEEYFRDEGEAWDNANIDGLPTQSVIKRGYNWAQSLISDDRLQAFEADDTQAPSYPVANEAYIEQYEAMRAMGAIQSEMTFEDWLATFGIRGEKAEEAHKPELLRHFSQWAYPANTVDPATGLPSGAASFSVAGRADKDRFFEEPGFIFGVTSVRPKVFMGNQKGSASIILDNWMRWLPALMRDQPHTSVAQLVGGSSAPTGPLRNQDADGYWVDARDLFLYGDEYRSADLGGYSPALPTSDSEYRWGSGAMADALFADAGANKFRQDGVTSIHILSHPATATDMT